MESIFYAVLALHAAGKPVSQHNIRSVLEAAGSPVNEPALDAMTALVEALDGSASAGMQVPDSRIIKYLTSEVVNHELQTGQVNTLLGQLRDLSTGMASVQAIPWTGGSVAGGDTTGRYVYGIGATGATTAFERSGVGGSHVRTIPYQGICAIVHDCLPQPYQSQDRQTVEVWVQEHQAILDEARDKLGTVIPLGFDTIIRSSDANANTDLVVTAWLSQNYEKLTGIIEAIKGKDEYGVQVFYDTATLRARIVAECQAVRQMTEKISGEPTGLAYLHRQQLEKILKAEVYKAADRLFSEFHERVSRHCVNVVVDKTKKTTGGKEMLMNLSCLVATRNVDALGRELEGIDNSDGFSVSFTGPWPPYSFVTEVKASLGARQDEADQR